MKVLGHIAVIAVLLLALVGAPAAYYGDFSKLLSPDLDTTSAATAIQDAPSGHYTIAINRDRHASSVLPDWVSFFSGEDAPLIMEDIACVALAGDLSGIEMAQSLQSRLPENQMKLRVEDAILALSKAESGNFDALVISDEAASAYGASSLYKLDFVEVINR